MSRTELSQRRLTACETRSRTALMRPLFHTSPWFVLLLAHTSALPSSYMGDLQIRMKVQCDVRDGDLFLRTICEWQNRRDASCDDQSFQSVFYGMSHPLMGHLMLKLCHSHTVGKVPNSYWLLDAGFKHSMRVLECVQYFMLEIKLNTLLNVYFLNFFPGQPIVK